MEASISSTALLAVDPFVAFAQSTEGFFEPFGLRFGTFGGGQPDDVFTLAGGGEFLEVFVCFFILLKAGS